MSTFRNLMMGRSSSAPKTPNVITVTAGSLNTYSWSSRLVLGSDLTLLAVWSDGSTTTAATLSSGSNSGSFGLASSLTLTLKGFSVSPASDDKFAYSVAFSTTTETISVSPTTLSFTSSSGSGTIAVTADCEWTAATGATWLTVSQSAASGDGMVTVTAAKNTATSSRTGTVTITTAGGILKTVSVTQEAAASTSTVNTITVTKTSASGVNIWSYAWASTYALASDITLYAYDESGAETGDSAVLSSGSLSGTFTILPSTSTEDGTTSEEPAGFFCSPTSDSSYSYEAVIE